MNRKPVIAVITRHSREFPFLGRVLGGLKKQKGVTIHWVIVSKLKFPDVFLDQARSAGIEIIIVNAPKTASLGHLANIGVQASGDADYILLHDDDDELRNNFFAPAIKLIETTKASACACHAAIIRENAVTNSKKLDFILSPGSDFMDEDKLAVDNLVATNALIYRKDIAVPYPEDVAVAEDWLFTLSLIKNGKIAILPKVCANVYQRHVEHDNTCPQEHKKMETRIRGAENSERQLHNQKLAQRLKRFTDRLTYKLGFFLPR